MTEQFANFSQSTLSSPISASQTSIAIATPQPGHSFPSQGKFRIVVQSFDPTTLQAISAAEIMIVTAVNGNNFTVQRGQENTSAMAFASGATVAHIVTAGVMTALESGGSSGGGRGLQIVTTRGTLINSIRQGTSGSRTDVRIETRNYYYVGPQAISQIRVANTGFILTSSGEAPLGNDHNWEVAIENVSPSTYSSFYKYGANLITMLNNTPLSITEPAIGFDFPAGGGFYLRQAFSVANDTLFIPIGTGGTVTGSPSDAGYLSPSTTSQVQGTGSLSNPSGGTSANGISPAMILGIPAASMPSVIFIGDSIPDGTGDTSDGHGNLGFIARGLWQVGPNNYPIPWTKQTHGSWTLAKCTIDTSPGMRAMWPFCTHIINQLGTNDIAGSGTGLSAMQTYLTNLWTAQKRVIGPYGKPLQVAQSLLMPRTTSTDSWATAVNQTPVSGFTVGGTRDQLNAWVKTQVGGGLLDAYIDPNQYVEDQSNLGKWITNGTPNYPTTDGIHPSSALHILAAQAVNAWASGIAP